MAIVALAYRENGGKGRLRVVAKAKTRRPMDSAGVWPIVARRGVALPSNWERRDARCLVNVLLGRAKLDGVQQELVASDAVSLYVYYGGEIIGWGKVHCFVGEWPIVTWGIAEYATCLVVERDEHIDIADFTPSVRRERSERTALDEETRAQLRRLAKRRPVCDALRAYCNTFMRTEQTQAAWSRRLRAQFDLALAAECRLSVRLKHLATPVIELERMRARQYH